MSYSPWERHYHWRTGIFHLSPELDAFVDGFFETDQELALCQIVGHSYDLDAEDMWDKMESIFCRIAGDEDIAPMTHIELFRYLDAIKRVVIGEESVYNPTETELWFCINGRTVRLEPKETVYADI